MKIGEWCRALAFAASIAGLLPPVATAKPAAALEEFDIAREPATADWRFFIKSPEANREKLWSYHQGRGKGLKDWAWGWRLGWVRVCGQSNRPLCGEILRAALFDKALVVRA